MLYPQNGDRTLTIDFVTSLRPMYMQCVYRQKVLTMVMELFHLEASFICLFDICSTKVLALFVQSDVQMICIYSHPATQSYFASLVDSRMILLYLSCGGLLGLYSLTSVSHT